MLKAYHAFAIGMLIIGNVFAGPEPLDCQTSSTIEQNLDELDKVTKTVTDECPKPTKEQFQLVCGGIYNLKESTLDAFNFTYQEKLWKLACADADKDSPEVAKSKIQTMWMNYRTEFRCYNFPTSAASGKNITKFSIDNGFSEFILEAVKEYKLDMNFKDLDDQKTIMDFLKERKEYIQSSLPVDTLKVAEYERIYKFLEKNGAKHAKDL